MRPLLAILGVIIVFIGIAAYTSRFTNAEPTMTEKADMQAQEEAKKNFEMAKKNAEKAQAAAQNPARKALFDKYKEGAVRATLEIEGRGTITLELYPKAAPKTVEHFVELCKKNFYEGILFHRVEPGFVAQAGDPGSKKLAASDLKGLDSKAVGQKFMLGAGGSGTTVPLENNLPHLPFSIGLARSDAPDSGDSQFYINLKDNGELDSGYCVFGRIVEGEKLAADIAIGDRIKRLSVP